MRYVYVVLLGALVAGCARNSAPLTPVEQEEQEVRMRNSLQETSVRSTNDHPKVTPEFTRTFTTNSSSSDKAQTEKPLSAYKDDAEDLK